MLAVITVLTEQCLKDIPVESIAKAGARVRERLAAHRRQFPSADPTWKGGLLGTSATPIDDFRLAQQLFPDDQLGWSATSIHQPAPLLLSYVATVCAGDDWPTDGWIESALFFVAIEIGATSASATQWRSELQVEVERLEPVAKHGQVFLNGRKKGAIGKVRKAIRSYLSKHPGSKPRQVWDALARNPPPGLRFFENRLGTYIESDDSAVETKFRRFQNIVYEEIRKAS